MGIHFVSTIQVDPIPANQQAYTMKLLAVFALVFISAASGAVIQKVTKAFSVCDTNKDGALDAGELVDCLEDLGIDADDEQATTIIQKINGKDSVTLAELQSSKDSIRQAVKQYAATFRAALRSLQ